MVRHPIKYNKLLLLPPPYTKQILRMLKYHFETPLMFVKNKKKANKGLFDCFLYRLKKKKR